MGSWRYNNNQSIILTRNKRGEFFDEQNKIKEKNK